MSRTPLPPQNGADTDTGTGVPDPDVAATLGLDEDGRRHRRRWPWVVGLLVVAAVGLGIALRPGRGDAPDFRSAEVSRDDLTVQVTAVGTVEPLHSVAIGSDISGTVAEVMVDSNDHVTAGQVLATLDTDLLQAQLRQAEALRRSAAASLKQARVTVASADKELGRAKQLHAAAALSESQLDQAATARDQAAAAVEVAAAQLAQAQASLEAARENLDKATVTTPIAGVVLSRSVEPGQAVISTLQAATLFEVAEDLARMSIDVEIDEADVGRVLAGQEADFTVPAFPDRVFPAHVHKVELAPAPNTAVVTYIACLHLDNSEGLLRPGMTATARISAEEHTDVLLVPTAALRFSPPDVDLPPPTPREGRKIERVWVDGLTGPSPVEIVTGASDGRRAVVLEGDLDEGDVVLTGIRGEQPQKRSGMGHP